MSKPYDDEWKTHAYSKSVFKTLLMVYRPYLSTIVVYLILGFLGRFLLLGNANMIGYWVDTLCTDSQICRPVPALFINWQQNDFLWALAALTFFGFIITAIFRVGLSRVSAKAVSLLYDEVTLRTSRQPMTFFDTTPAGRIITRFSSDYGNVFRMFGGPLAEFLAIIFDLTAMILLILMASPYYLIIVLFIALSNYTIYRFNKARLRESRRQLSGKRAPSIAHFAETTQGAVSIRIFSRTYSFLKRFVKLDKLFLDQRMDTLKKLISFGLQMSLSTSALIMITGGGAYFLVQNKVLSIGSVGVAFAFITLSSTMVQMYFDWLAQFEEAMIGVERLDRYLQSPMELGSRLPHSPMIKTSHPEYPKDLTNPTLNHTEIEFKNVSFRYGSQSPWILKNINFKIQPGQTVGIIGRTGSGKSSLIQSLLYLYPIEQGNISLGGLTPQLMSLNAPPSSQEMDLEFYRRHFAMITQEPFLMKGSLRENLDLTQIHSDQEIIDSLNHVGLGPWFEQLPHGLRSHIEERGKNLSQGEKQLLCLTRCLLQDAPIIIMDEATSSVDPQSEEIMVKATEEFFKGRTQIIIAHRLSTLKKCDLVIWLDNGQIKKMDTPSKVLPDFEEAELNPH